MGVVVYSTNHCPWCVKAREYLDSLKVAYESVNISEDRDAASEVVRKTRQRGVPVIKVGERYIVGFDQSGIDSALRDADLI